MQKTASLEQALLCQMFSKSKDQQQIATSIQNHPFVSELCEQLMDVQYMFDNLHKAVPHIELEDYSEFVRRERSKNVQVVHVNNVIHVPFVQNVPPMYIVLQPASAELLKDIQLQLLPLMELCAVEGKDCIIFAGDEKPIVFTKGIVNYDAFMRLMSLQEIQQRYPFERLIQNSIAKPFAPKSDVVFVDLAEHPLHFTQKDIALFDDLKNRFQCSLKALVASDVDDGLLTNLLDEVFVKMN